MAYYNQANHTQQAPYNLKSTKFFYGKRPHPSVPSSFNKNFALDANESAITAANIILLTAPTPSPNALVKNIISPACSIVVRCNSESFNLRVGLISNEVATQSFDGSTAKVELSFPKENVGFLKYYALDGAGETNPEDGADKGIKAEVENGGAKEEKKTKAVYTGRLIIGLKQCLTKLLESNKLIDSEKFLSCRLFVVEFKGHPVNKKINPSYVFGNSFKNGPFKGMDDIKSWEGADETTLKKAIEYHVDISRKEEEKTECEHCSSTLQRRLLELHKNTVCSKRPVECPHCKQNLSLDALNEHKKAECPEIVRPCSNGCEVSLKHDELAAHSLSCARKPEPCPFRGYGCEQQERHDAMEQHEKDAVHRHLALVEKRLAGVEAALKALRSSGESL